MSNFNFNYEYNNNNQDGFQSSMDTSTNNTRKNISNQNLRPVTIKQIYNAQQPVPEGPFKLNGKDLDLITIIGKIQNIQSMSTNTNYTIEDGTGSIDVRIWIDTNDNENDAQKRSQLSEGVYIRVVGSARFYHDKKSVMAFHIRPIEDFNEITAHFLEIVKIQLYDIKNDSPFGDNGDKNLPSFNNSDYAPQNYNNNVEMSSTGGYSPCQQAIINLIRSQKLGEEGMHVNTICSMLRSKFSEDEIKASIDWLVSECHLYNTTIDETHVNVVQF